MDNDFKWYAIMIGVIVCAFMVGSYFISKNESDCKIKGMELHYSLDEIKTMCRG